MLDDGLQGHAVPGGQVHMQLLPVACEPQASLSLAALFPGEDFRGPSAYAYLEYVDYLIYLLLGLPVWVCPYVHPPESEPHLWCAHPSEWSG